MTQTPPAFTEDPLDRDYLERNYLALGCADVLADVVSMYLESAPEKITGIHTALTAGDLEQLARLAHGLKGESGSVGARHVTALAARLEQHARQGSLDDCRELLPLLEQQYARTSTLLRQEMTA